MNFKNLKFNHLDSISNLKLKIENYIYYFLILFLPTQLGKHFWPDFSFVAGLRIDYLSPIIYFTDILVGLLFICWLIRFLSKNPEIKSKVKSQKSKAQLKIQNYKNLLILLLVISYLTLVTVFSGEIFRGLYLLLKIFEMGFVAFYTANFVGIRNRFEKVILILIVGVVFESILAIAQFVNQKSIGGILYFLGERTFNGSTPGIANASLNGELVLRPYGTFSHPNVLAGYLVIVMVIVLFSLRFRKLKKHSGIRNQQSSSILKVIGFQYSLFSSLILGTVALFLTMSRVAMLLWVLILGYYLTRKINMKRYAFLILGVMILFLHSPFGSRFTQITKVDEAFVQREILIKKSFQMINSSPLFGVGIGNFIPGLVQFQDPLYTSAILQPVHNIFLLVAAETGLIGLGFFVWFFWIALIRIKKQEARIKVPLIIALSVVLLTGFFDHYWLTLQQGQLLFAFMIGLCWANIKPLKN